MLCLGVDTSTPAGSVALLDGDRLVAELNLDAGGHHQGRLLRSIDLVLELAGLDFSRVGALGVALGPGSFTGLRVGIATVKGLAVAQGVPAYGFSTLQALGWRPQYSGFPVCAMIDAGRGEIYAALFRLEGAGMIEALPERSQPPADFIAALPGEPAYFCGEGVRIHRGLIARLRDQPDILDTQPCFLGATVARLAARRHAEGATWSLASLRPNYIRPPDAELPRKA